MRNILTLGRYFKQKYKGKIAKLPLGITGFTCPNIDGKVARGGCTYCQNESFSPNMSMEKKSFKLRDDSSANPILEMQLKELEKQYVSYAKILHQEKGAQKFLAYFQSFSNTYAPAETLKKLYDKALGFEDCIGLSIGTRSDCVSDEILLYLQKKSKKYEIWVEYGVQSVFDTTLEAINRAEKVEAIEEQIRKTKKIGINVCAHLIFGLPGETQEMMLASVKKCIEWGVDSIKFHPLYVVENTALAADYKRGEFEPISESLYIDTLVKAVKMLPENIVVQRITAGVDDDSLLTPAWCYNKNSLVKKIRQIFIKNGLKY